MHALVLAGGQGTRLRPLTDTRPKPLVPFCGEPFAAGLLRRFGAAGVEHVTLLISRDPAPYATLREFGAGLGIVVETSAEERPLDTAGAARRLLRGHRDGPVLVCNGDVLTDLDLRALAAAHERVQATATIALTRVADTSSFGVVVSDGQDRVQRFVEKPAPGTLDADTVNAGTYVLGPGVFDAFPGDGPLSFERDVFPGLVDRGATVIAKASQAFWADLGTPERYLDGTAAVLEARCRWPLAPEMRFVADRVLVHDNARLGDATLEPGTVIGSGCRIADGASLAATVVFDRATVGPGARLERCIVGEAAEVAARVNLAGAVVPDRGCVRESGSPGGEW